LLLVVGGAYAWQGMLRSKFVESTQIDIYLSKTKMRTCGVEKLRSIGNEVHVKEDSLGGLIAEFSREPRMQLHISSVSENRTRIEGAWRAQDDTPTIRHSYESLINRAADLLLQCSAV
jgi:hypothetical protein